MNYDDKIAMVICNPLFASVAARLGREFKKVYLHIPFAGSFPTMNHALVGYGLPNVELVDSIFGPYFESVDLFVFPDLGYSQDQIHLEKLGKRVFGTRNGDEMEIWRETCKKVMADLGLPVQPWRVVKGISALREYLMEHEGVHVKIDKYRGVTESFFSPSYSIVETKLDAIEQDVGAFKDILEFIVEDDLPDCVEIGTDTFCIDGQYPEATLIGLEVKDQFYAGMMTKFSKLHPVLREWNEKMAAIFAKYGYRCSLSNELRITDALKSYCIDATCRFPSPPSELWTELFRNFCDILWFGAEGVVVEPDAEAKWGVEIILRSAWAENHWLPVEYPDKFGRQIKLYNCAIVDGRKYVIPQNEDMTEIGAVIGWGDSLEEALDHARKAGESIVAYGVKFNLGAAEEATEQIEKLDELGINPFEMAKEAKTT